MRRNAANLRRCGEGIAVARCEAVETETRGVQSRDARDQVGDLIARAKVPMPAPGSREMKSYVELPCTRNCETVGARPDFWILE